MTDDFEDEVLTKLTPKYESLSLGFMTALLQFLSMVFAHKANKMERSAVGAQYLSMSETFRTIARNIKYTWN